MYVGKYKKEDNQDIMPSREIINMKCSHACSWAPSHASHAYTRPTRMYQAQFNVKVRRQPKANTCTSETFPAGRPPINRDVNLGFLIMFCLEKV